MYVRVGVCKLARVLRYGRCINDDRVMKLLAPSPYLLKRRLPTLPLNAVPSARLGLTSLFGMGRGGTPTL